jgi:hypothetical protein
MPTVKFYALNDEAINRNSLVRASKVDFEWFNRAKRELDAEYPPDKFPHYPPKIYKCPGISSIIGTGWILKTYIGFTIETNGDGESFKLQPDENYKKFANNVSDGSYVDVHLPHQLADFKKFRENELRTVFKVNCPWVVDIPEGYSLLMMPVAYSDETRFTAATGLLKGKQNLNVQLFWHCLNSKEHIPAGTPLNQFILIKNEHVDYTISKIEKGNTILKDIFDLILKRRGGNSYTDDEKQHIQHDLFNRNGIQTGNKSWDEVKLWDTK